MTDICGLCFFFLFLLGSPIIVGGIFETTKVFISLKEPTVFDVAMQGARQNSNAPPATAFVDSAMFLSMNDE